MSEEMLPRSEINISLNGPAIYQEIRRGLPLWGKYLKPEGPEGPLGNLDTLGNQCKFPVTDHPLLESISLDATAKRDIFNGKKSTQMSIGTVLHTSKEWLTKHDNENGGYFDRLQVNKLVDLVQQNGGDNVTLENGKLEFWINGTQYSIGLGPIKGEQDPYGQGPTGHFHQQTIISLNAVLAKNQEGELPLSESDFVKACDNLSPASVIFIRTYCQLYGVPIPSMAITLDDSATMIRKQQEVHGYTISTYSDGQFALDGAHFSGQYDDLYNHLWEQKNTKRDQDGQYDCRYYCAGQELTMLKDSLTFGSTHHDGEGKEPDVYIDVDPNPITHEFRWFEGVSPLHFKVTRNTQQNGDTTDSLTIEDMHSKSGTRIVRKTETSRKMFGETTILFDQNPAQDEPVLTSIVLPGDIVMIGQDVRRAQLAYLGNGRFVKS